eukprot:gnl/MRDRNA2_/MRDRNA2_97104_c0_seq1.p1 gnl/MRDRNA2_/MRDRNA2_97104_c0~~gnl/MRDRNA2_/MRDRNA2_97104_c0_seq1.p1  ORF type:complete len:133 (+),score=21.47 gnl/MRDRNA2_/MRDRNA2_97104_c0_seq1:103-501(+)
MAQLAPCQIKLLKEVVQDPRAGMSVRVTGELRRLLPWCHRASLYDQGAQLWVDTSKLEAQRLQEGSLTQVLGELAALEETEAPLEDSEEGANSAHLILRARIARKVDGLDMALYEQCLQIHRQTERANVPAA